MTDKIETPWSSVGYLTYKRTYSRRLDENNPDGPTEEYPDTVDRIVNATNTQLGVNFTLRSKSASGITFFS